MDAGIDFAVQQLITKVESSQAIIDDLESQIQDLKQKLEAKIEFEFEAKFFKIQEELDYYYLLSRKQLELIQASEDLQARTARLLLGSDL